MTRIMTITSGLAQVGKTHLAVNLALELARRGGRVSVYHELDSAQPIEAVLALPHAITPRRRASDAQEVNDFIRRAYLGIDILSCRQPLRSWASGDATRLAACLDSLQTQQEYDAQLIDTSGMDPRTLVACCRASASVILVVTPDAHSQAEAFALLKVLVLNGYAGELWLLVNRAPDVECAQDIQRRFTTQVHAHLGGEIPLLGCVPEDDRVAQAQACLQAYSAIFPDCDAASAIVGLADALPPGPAVASVQGFLRTFWERVIEIMQEPVHLAGNALLPEEPVTITGQPHTTAAAVPADVNLFSHAGELADLPVVLEGAAESLQAAAATLGAFAARLDDSGSVLAETPATQLESNQLPAVMAQLLAALAADAAQEPVELWLDIASVATPDTDWLQPGRYLKYTLRMALSGGVAETRLRTLLGDIPVQSAPGAVAGTLQEILTPRHDACLDVFISPDERVRIQAWLPVSPTALSAAGLPVAGVVPAHKRLH
jgi:flagellar biosynthesis protein FlhG